MKTLLLIAILLTQVFAFTYNAFVDTQVPGPDNPYCNRRPSDFSPPAVALCPEGSVMNPDCLRACKDTYKASMVAAYNNACTRWNDANTDYKVGFRLALQHYDSCIDHAHNLEEREICRNACMAEINSVINNLNLARQRDAAHVTEDTASAVAAMAACAASCCHPQ